VKTRHRDGQDAAPDDTWQRDQDERNRELAERKAARKQRRAKRKARRAQKAEPVTAPGALRVPRTVALVVISVLVAGASLTSFAESYRGLFDWSREHGLSGFWSAVWPLQVDVFIAVGELALFVALADLWNVRSRVGAWLVTLTGLGVSVAGNVGHVHSHLLSDRATAAVPPIAAAAALAVGLGVLKRVVQAHGRSTPVSIWGQPGLYPVSRDALWSPLPSDAESAALASLKATLAAGNPWSGRQLETRFGLTRAQATRVRELAGINGHVPDEIPAAT
jgi:hypothetical protein